MTPVVAASAVSIAIYSRPDVRRRITVRSNGACPFQIGESPAADRYGPPVGSHSRSVVPSARSTGPYDDGAADNEASDVNGS